MLQNVVGVQRMLIPIYFLQSGSEYIRAHLHGYTAQQEVEAPAQLKSSIQIL